MAVGAETELAKQWPYNAVHASSGDYGEIRAALGIHLQSFTRGAY